MPLPLAHIRVLDLSRVLAGPHCTMLLGDLGAEVIKVERPQSGDDTRHWGPPFVGGESAYYLACNRNKKSITLNLKAARGREIAAALAEQSDVLVENLLPGTLDELGLGYEALSARNPRLVYCSISGFGQDGPYRDRPGYDLLVQAMGGVMSITGEPDGEPMKVGVAISDITAGLYAATAILAALAARERTGRGDRIDISLLDATVSWLANVASSYLVTGQPPGRYGNAHASIVPYQAFRAADDYFVVAVGNDGQWQRFCRAIERPDLAADERFRTNPQRVERRATLLPLLEQHFAARPAAYWLERLEQAEVPAAPVNTLDRVFADPQVLARGMLVEAQHPTIGALRMTGSPLKLRSIEARPLEPPPLLGQHTEEVLRERLGLEAAEIEALRAAGVV
ncbi:MAG TPA: CoA transferase [Burkholderiales bacterium]